MHKIDLANVSLSKMYGITTKTEISSGFSFQNTAKLRQWNFTVHKNLQKVPCPADLQTRRDFPGLYLFPRILERPGMAGNPPLSINFESAKCCQLVRHGYWDTNSTPPVYMIQLFKVSTKWWWKVNRLREIRFRRSVVVDACKVSYFIQAKWQKFWFDPLFYHQSTLQSMRSAWKINIDKL